MHLRLNLTLKSSLTTMKNERVTKVMVLGMGRNHFMLGHLNRVISRFILAGITKHLSDYGMWFLLRQFDDELVDPRRILSLSDLEFGFVLWLVACFLSLLCFVSEVTFVKLKNLMLLTEFLRVLKAKVESYHDVWW
jgi:hypothetical protein